jgi:O-acetyl-ADP-ribose deacetylase
MPGEGRTGQARVTLRRGDITEQRMDAVVNAANTTLLGGGGVDGAIHRAGGPAILDECRLIRARQGGCPTGRAVMTTGGRLPVRFVIHAVGPVWSGGQRDEDELLASAYRASLRLAAERQLRSVGFPAISTGAYRFPIERAAAIALETVFDFLTRERHELDEVRFILYSDADLAAWERVRQRLTAEPGDRR